MTGYFQNRLVLITGASGGVGQIVTLRWLAAGADVVAVDMTAGHLDRLRAAFDSSKNDASGRLVATASDMTTVEGATRAFDEARSNFGRPADTLIHLIGGFAAGDFDALDAIDTWQRMISLNLMSSVHSFRAALPGFRECGHGWITALSARAATQPSPSMCAYAASKAALISLIQSLAAEVGDRDIHVNAMLASTIDTPANRSAMGESNAAKWVRPDDIADATFYLCSDRARAINGATLEIYARV